MRDEKKEDDINILEREREIEGERGVYVQKLAFDCIEKAKPHGQDTREYY